MREQMTKLLALPLSLMLVGTAQAGTLNCRLAHASGFLQNIKYTITEDDGRATVTLSTLDNKGDLVGSKTLDTVFYRRATEMLTPDGPDKGDTKSLVIVDGGAQALGFLPDVLLINWTKSTLESLEKPDDGSEWVCI